MLRHLFLLCLTGILLLPTRHAIAWEATLSDDATLPPSLVAVDKSGRKLFYMEKQSPLAVRNAFPSIHGQKEGDKNTEGDMRTPEGVYFVTGKVRSPLDFEEYGSQAHALNYPNPVDRLRGKSGSGIWIHSKGKPIANQATRGCIAIDLDNIAALEPKLIPGTPVVVAESVVSDAIMPMLVADNSAPHVEISADSGVNTPAVTSSSLAPAKAPGSMAGMVAISKSAASSAGEALAEPAGPTPNESGAKLPLSEAAPTTTRAAASASPTGEQEKSAPSNIAKLLTERTAAWNKAWGSRSKDMFDYYDADAYTVAQGENFGSFRAQKESLFNRFPWISTQIGEVSVLQGPGYWVTWFPQYYRAPNLRTEGIRRLYWQPVKGGELKIVGMEWLPQDLGMERAYLDTLAPSVITFVEDWRKAWQKGDLKAYMAAYTPTAKQDSRNGSAAIREHKERTWAVKKPVAVEFFGTRIQLESNGVRVDMTQVYRDTSGYSDKGVKELMLYPDGDSWRISSESWSRMP